MTFGKVNALEQRVPYKFYVAIVHAMVVRVSHKNNIISLLSMLWLNAGSL
jgi:hypothetical protein